jgi:Flp pilus assembly protein TadG
MSLTAEARAATNFPSNRWRGKRDYLLGLLLIPVMIGALGIAFDYARVENFKTQLQDIADDAALAGAIVYLDRDSKLDAAEAARDSFSSNSERLVAGLVPPTVKISTTPAHMQGENGFGVTVEVTGEIASTFVAPVAAVRSVTVTAMALNPLSNTSKESVDLDASAMRLDKFQPIVTTRR